jgi:hypothetical protein
VAYVAAGTLVNESLTKEPAGAYGGEVTVEVKRTNHHARADKGTTKTYTVERAHVKFVRLTESEVKAGDRVRLIGKITALAKKCPAAGFEPAVTIRRIVFHAPKPARP